MIDENHRQYATERQWEYYLAVEEHGSGRKAAEVFGVNKSVLNRSLAALRRNAAIHGYAPAQDMTHGAPDGMKSAGTSTLYDMATGDAKIQWVKFQADKERQEEIFRETVAALSEEIPPAKPIPGPDKTNSNLMAGYPVGDHHFGMYSWAEEAGRDWDLKIAERALSGAYDYLINTLPSCDQATIVLLGDLFHYDSFVTETPTSKNQLDADSRYPMMVRAVIRSTRQMIDKALLRHGELHIIVEIGNHDLSNSVFLMECLSALYEKEPRVTVDTSPRHFHYFTFGKTLVGIHHGHGVKLDKLPLIMAADRPKDWGETKYRYWWTGHIHTDTMKDFVGCRVESFRVLPPEDAWAANKGYRSMSDMKAIVLHKEFGEVARHTVNPAMLDG